jgi:hypothetical protein
MQCAFFFNCVVRTNTSVNKTEMLFTLNFRRVGNQQYCRSAVCQKTSSKSTLWPQKPHQKSPNLHNRAS